MAEPAPAPHGDGTAPKAKPKEKIEYAVYEAIDFDPAKKPADVLHFVGIYKAEDKDAARWMAVDGDDDLRKRVVDDGNTAYLLPVALRLAIPAGTAEEVVEKKVRR